MTDFRFRRTFHRAARLLVIAVALIMQFGCATYYSHYAMFSAESSQNEPRTIRLSWHSAEYPSWWFLSDRATPLTLETQCSERTWRLYDSSHSRAGACGEGIRACGKSGADRRVPEGRPAHATDACIVINPSDPGAQIVDISGRLELLVACQPASPVRNEGGDEIDVDYIHASSVPYTVYSRKTPRGRLNARPPEFDRAACNAD